MSFLSVLNVTMPCKSQFHSQQGKSHSSLNSIQNYYVTRLFCKGIIKWNWSENWGSWAGYTWWSEVFIRKSDFLRGAVTCKVNAKMWIHSGNARHKSMKFACSCELRLIENWLYQLKNAIIMAVWWLSLHGSHIRPEESTNEMFIPRFLSAESSWSSFFAFQVLAALNPISNESQYGDEYEGSVTVMWTAVSLYIFRQIILNIT